MNRDSADISARIRAILDADTEDMVALMKIAGFDDPKMFEGGDWRGADFRKTDLRGYSFNHCDITGAKFTGALTRRCTWENITGKIPNDTNDLDRPHWDLKAFERMMGDAANYSSAVEVYETLKWQNAKASLIFLNRFLSKAETTGQSEYVSLLYKHFGVLPDKYTYSMLLKLAPDEATAYALGLDMLKECDDVDLMATNIWLMKLRSKELIDAALSKMVERELRPDSYTYNMLIDKAADFETAFTYFRAMEISGIGATDISLNSLMKKVGSYDNAMKVIEFFKFRKVDISLKTLNTMLSIVETDEEARKVMALFEEFHRSPDTFTYNIALKNAGSFTRAQQVVEDLLSSGNKPDDYTVSGWLRYADNKTDIRTVLRFRLAHQLPVSEPSVKVLERKLDRMSINIKADLEAIRAFESMKPEHLYARIAVELAATFEEKLDWLVAFSGKTPYYGQTTAVALAKLVESKQQAESLLVTLKNARVFHNVKFFEALFRRLAKRLRAVDILAIYVGSTYKYPGALDAAVGIYLQRGETVDALRIALPFPFLPNCQVAISQAGEFAVEFFKEFMFEQNYDATYALGYAYTALGQSEKAIKSFQRAHKLTNIEARIRDIEAKLKELGAPIA